MDRELKELRQIPLFVDLDDDYLEGASLLWEVRKLPADEILWLQGQPSQELALLCSGILEVHINETELAKISMGEMIGELATFTNDSRSASVSAAEDSILLILSIESLHTMRESHPVMYDLLLSAALQKMARRIHEMDREIARIALGETAAPERKEDGVLLQFFKRLSGTGNRRPPLATSVLRKLPRLKEAPTAELELILGAMRPHFVEKGKPLFLEGERGESVFLLVDGCMDVMRNVKRGMAERLATLYPGALLGTGALLLKERRNAGCIASQNTDVWVYELDRAQHDGLSGQAGRIWRESLLMALAFQLRNADDRWILLKQGVRPKMTDYDKVRSSLLGYQG